MPRAKRAEIEELDRTGLKYFHQLDSLLQALHNVGCDVIGRVIAVCIGNSIAGCYCVELLF